MMNNLSAEAFFFDGASINWSDAQKFDLIGGRKTTPAFPAKRKGEDMLCIPELTFFLSVSANEELDDAGSPIRCDGETPDNTFFLNERYQMLLRVSEPKSGKFVDLDIFDIAPDTEAITIPGFKVFNERKLLKYKRIPVQDSDSKTCILKILFRHEGKEKWTVHGIQPIKLFGDF